MTVGEDVYVIGNVIYFCLMYPLTLSVLQIPQQIFKPFGNTNFPDAFCAKVELAYIFIQKAATDTNPSFRSTITNS